MKFTEIKISGLKNGNHNFHFDLDSSFLTEFSTIFFDQPKVSVDVNLNLTETMIKADLDLKGILELVCDRSDETFDFHINFKVLHFFKIGDEEKELSDELEVISKERISIDLDQLIYDSLALSIPAKKLHPRYNDIDDDSNSDGILIYSSESDKETDNSEEDPRWQKLKELSSLN